MANVSASSLHVQNHVIKPTTVDCMFRLMLLLVINFTAGVIILRHIPRRAAQINNEKNPSHSKRERNVSRSQPPSVGGIEPCQLYRDLYFKLHHLEHHNEVLPRAKSLLLSFLSGALSIEQSQKGILSMKHFAPDALDAFMQTKMDEVTSEWRGYLQQRKAGQPRKLFQSDTEARHWLVQNAPVRFVDGAWLGHIHKATTAFADRKITKGAWQVLSEELGDGDLARNHAFVYSELLRKIGAIVPAPDSRDFIQHAGFDDENIWRSAVAQLLISLFPDDFLPEILGFNMQFEMPTLETMVAAKELREVGFDPYYFTLHITIDNADTGHTAMSSYVVKEYIHSVAARHGWEAAHQAWKRVQTGFALSKNLPSYKPAKSSLVKGILDLFQAKAMASNGVHEHCKMRFGKRTLSTWLDRSKFSQLEWREDFLRCLSEAKPWVYKGDSARSRLIHQLSWGGSMFGAFTDREVAAVRDWIDSLVFEGAETYRTFTGRTDLHQTRTLAGSTGIISLGLVPSKLDSFNGSGWDAGKKLYEMVDVDTSKLDIEKLMGLWFVHPCLLECFVSIPWRVANPIGCAVLRILRSQNGFLPEPIGVDGMDEIRREDHIDLIGIGMELHSKNNPTSTPPQTLTEVLQRWPSPFAETLLVESMKPQQNGWLLLGMCQAFTQLHGLLAKSDLLSARYRIALGQITQREQSNLNICIEQLRGGEKEYIDFHRGFMLGRQEIEQCFGGNGYRVIK